MRESDLWSVPEGRRIELKKELPARPDWLKTIVAFANDAGGDLFVGIQEHPRQVTGIPESELSAVEERVANLIYEHCSPVIVPDITRMAVDALYVLRIRVYRGSDLPYFIKGQGMQNGTYVRVGSTNRKADSGLIAELNRRRRNIPFDGELLYDLPWVGLSISAFSARFAEVTGEPLHPPVLRKMGLVKEERGVLLPVNALALLADAESRSPLFPYAKIECARFKGTDASVRIDEKSILSPVCLQPGEALAFIQRHVNRASHIEGVYTVGRWEYPMEAITECLRNAVVHRDYSLTGMDIKVAIYDDMIEISSPGLPPPTIDFALMEARQSDVRNKTLAPVFKTMGLIDQWGNGLNIIAHSMKNYPEIEFKWFEKGTLFQVQFVKRGGLLPCAVDASLPHRRNMGISGVEEHEPKWTALLASRSHQAGTRLAPGFLELVDLLNFLRQERSIRDLMEFMNWRDRTKFRRKYLVPAMGFGLVERTVPHRPSSPDQCYVLSKAGYDLLEATQGFIDR